MTSFKTNLMPFHLKLVPSIVSTIEKLLSLIVIGSVNNEKMTLLSQSGTSHQRFDWMNLSGRLLQKSAGILLCKW
jgi:hypothetical protein